MLYIGKLNKSIIGEYGDKIVTSDVILTDERKLHIYKKHFLDFDIILNNLYKAVMNPDEILDDLKNENTLMYIYKLQQHNLNVVVKLNTVNSNKDLKNSIMTAWLIREKNLKKVRRKNRIIYKNE